MIQADSRLRLPVNIPPESASVRSGRPRDSLEEVRQVRSDWLVGRGKRPQPGGPATGQSTSKSGPLSRRETPAAVFAIDRALEVRALDVAPWADRADSLASETTHGGRAQPRGPGIGPTESRASRR